MDNKICLVTGGTSGVVKVIALELAKREAHVILVARNKEKAESLNPPSATNRCASTG